MCAFKFKFSLKTAPAQLALKSDSAYMLCDRDACPEHHALVGLVAFLLSVMHKILMRLYLLLLMLSSEQMYYVLHCVQALHLCQQLVHAVLLQLLLPDSSACQANFDAT